ncbi:hypothetical protein BLOT_009741 [Blomia tropicalis]|nr:hypothetical protein BLOT_009741 [Blomia tropicalis]
MQLIHKILNRWPMKNKLGFYAYLPAFFVLGAMIEFTMINMKIGNVDFYTVYMRKERERMELEAQMPFGLTWTAYVSRLALCLAAMAAGSQFVHSIYKPIDNVQSIPIEI